MLEKESFPTPRFRSINSSVLSFLYGLTFASYMTTGKTIALTRWTFVGKLMSLPFNMLSRLVIAFLPRSKRLLISWLQPPSVALLEPKKICHRFHCFPIHLPWSDETRCHDLSFLALQFLFAFCHKGGVICISDVIVISPSNLDSSCASSSCASSVSHDVLCI